METVEPEAESESDPDPELDETPWVLLPEKYASSTTSELTATISTEPSEHMFELVP